MDSLSDSLYSINANKNKTKALSVFFNLFMLLEINTGKIFSQLPILCKENPEIIMVTYHVDKHTISTCRNTFELTKFISSLICQLPFTFSFPRVYWRCSVSWCFHQ